MKIIQPTISGETSSIIRAIRFPLAILVVMLHSGIAVTEWQYHIIAAPTANVDIYMYMYIAVCETLCRVAVPLFFFISGYLFFSGMDKWSWVKYKEKMGKRIHTLLVPYLIWVTLFVVLCLAKNYLQHHSISSILEYVNVRNGLLMWLNGVTTESGVDILGQPTYQSFPLLYPMWYIRDLFAMTIITPPIYCLMKRKPVNYIVVSLLILFYLLKLPSSIGFIDISAISFFILGAFVFLNHIDITTMAYKHRWLLLFVTITLFILSVVFHSYHTALGQSFLGLFILGSIPLSFAMMKKVLDYGRIEKVSELSYTTFFIFAVHVFILSFTKPVIENVTCRIFGLDSLNYTSDFVNSHLGIATMFWTVNTIVAILISVVLAVILQRISPRIFNLLTGK